MFDDKNNTAVTAVQLNVQTFINREPQCHDPWFQPTDEVLHYVGLLGHFSSLKKN